MMTRCARHTASRQRARDYLHTEKHFIRERERDNLKDLKPFNCCHRFHKVSCPSCSCYPVKKNKGKKGKIKLTGSPMRKITTACLLASTITLRTMLYTNFNCHQCCFRLTPLVHGGTTTFPPVFCSVPWHLLEFPWMQGPTRKLHIDLFGAFLWLIFLDSLPRSCSFQIRGQNNFPLYLFYPSLLGSESMCHGFAEWQTTTPSGEIILCIVFYAIAVFFFLKACIWINPASEAAGSSPLQKEAL